MINSESSDLSGCGQLLCWAKSWIRDRLTRIRIVSEPLLPLKSSKKLVLSFYLVQVIIWFVWLWHPIRGLLECLLASGLECFDQGDYNVSSCYNLISQQWEKSVQRPALETGHTNVFSSCADGAPSLLMSRHSKQLMQQKQGPENWSTYQFICR